MEDCMKKKLTLFLAFSLIVCCFALTPASKADAAQKKPKLNVKKLEMTLGESFHLRIYNMKKNQKATYVSSNPSLVSVKPVNAKTRKAVIKADAIGSSVIKVMIPRKKAKPFILKCRVTVSPGPVSIKFIKRKIAIKCGQSSNADMIIKPSASTERPVFESSNPSVVRVNPFGVITGISPGTATITATLLSSNLTATCTVIVKPSFSID